MLAGIALALAATAAQPTAPSASVASGNLAFAATLEAMPLAAGPKAWPTISDRDAWAALAAANPTQRQAARWRYALSLIGKHRGPDARGVLDIMRHDDKDLMMVAAYRRAVVAAMVEAGDNGGAIGILEGDGSASLQRDPEACAWRMRALAARPVEALEQIGCALPALNARQPQQRRTFLLAAAQAALMAGQPGRVASLLRVLPSDDLAAGLIRGRAMLALGDAAKARVLLTRIQREGRAQQRIAAELALLEASVAAGTITPAASAKQADHLAFVWRGDTNERRSLAVSYRIGVERNDLSRRLVAGAALVRHFPMDAGLAVILADLQLALGRALAPGSGMPIDRAAGLYWNYRDLAPAGAAGDFLVGQLADRLQERGLYARAGDLLKHLLLMRTTDVTQGPLSARVASLYILAGQPAAALAVMRATDRNNYPPEMLWARHRVEAVALLKTGRVAEALAAVQDLPDAGLYRAEIYWQRRDWGALAAATSAVLPTGTNLLPVEQVIVLRQAIALAMLGREPALAALRSRYLSSFGGLANQASFDLLTRDASSLDEQVFTRAMMSLPPQSPVADAGNLFDAPVAASAKGGA